MPDYKVTSGLPALPSADEKTFPFLLPIYNAINAIAKKLSLVGGEVDYSQVEMANLTQTTGVKTQNTNKLIVKALEDLSWGTIVTVVLDSGKLAVRKADATNGTKPAHGCVATIEGIATGQFGEITVLGGHTLGITGTTVGQYYWLSTAGLVQPAAPTAAGTLVQGLGWGMGSAGFMLQISSQIHTNP